MGILSAIFLGLGALGVAANSERASTYRINAYMKERCADGFERVTNKELEDQYYREALQLWCRSVTENNPDLFYPEKWEFFRANPSRATDWAFDIACEKIIADGYAPWWVPGPFSMKRFGNHAWYRMAGGFDAEKEFYRDRAQHL